MTYCTKRDLSIINTLSVKLNTTVKHSDRITNTLLGNTRNIVLPDYDDIVLLAEKLQFEFSSKVEKIHGQITVKITCQQHQSYEKHTSSSLRMPSFNHLRYDCQKHSKKSQI